MRKPKRPAVRHPTTVRLTDEMRDFLRDEAAKRGRFNDKFGSGDVSYIIKEVLEQYRSFITKSKNRTRAMPK